MIFKSLREYKRETILTPIFMAGECLFETIIPFVMALLIDEGISVSNKDNIILYGLLLIALSLFSLFFGIMSGVFASRASSGLAKNIRKDIYYKVQDYSFQNIDKFSSSSIVTRLTTDVSNIQNAFQMIIRTAVRSPLMLIFSLIMAFNISPTIALYFLLVVPILGTTLILITKYVHKYFVSVFETYDVLNNNVQENVRGIRVVKSYAEEYKEKRKFTTISEKIFKTFTKAEKIVAINQPIMQTCMYFLIIMISWLSAHYIVEGTMKTGSLASLITYATSILMSLMMLSMTYVMITISMPSIKRCNELLEEEPSIKNNDKRITNVKDGSIIFKNVSFSYVNDKNKLSLKKVNLNIKSGEIIGIIGGTGSSKSTLVNLIPRLYDTSIGSVLVGGVDVKDYDLKVLRDNVSMVLQKNVLFSGTIKENLLWGNKNATDEEIEEVIKISCADEFIKKFDGGLNYKIEQGGVNVSGGQKQRLCIARALLKKPKILILDDSTSACDTKTDRKIREGFKKYLKDVTKIIITQRISSVMDADKVIVLDKGEVKGFDTPKNLLKNNKIFKEEYYLQMKGDDNNA